MTMIVEPMVEPNKPREAAVPASLRVNRTVEHPVGSTL